MTGKNDLREALVLVVLDGLKRRGKSPIQEYELHQLIRRLQPSAGTEFCYLDRPISYSYELTSYLKSLERSHYLNELIMVRNGWVPRLEYEVSLVGGAQAKERRERMQVADARFLARLEEELDEFASKYRPPVAINPR